MRKNIFFLFKIYINLSENYLFTKPFLYKSLKSSFSILTISYFFSAGHTR